MLVNCVRPYASYDTTSPPRDDVGAMSPCLDPMLNLPFSSLILSILEVSDPTICEIRTSRLLSLKLRVGSYVLSQGLRTCLGPLWGPI